MGCYENDNQHEADYQEIASEVIQIVRVRAFQELTSDKGANESKYESRDQAEQDDLRFGILEQRCVSHDLGQRQCLRDPTYDAERVRHGNSLRFMVYWSRDARNI